MEIARLRMRLNTMFVIDEFTSKGFLNVNLYEVPNSVDIWGTLRVKTGHFYWFDQIITVYIIYGKYMIYYYIIII